MDLSQVRTELSKRFERSRIVFWYDEEGEFDESIHNQLDEVLPEGVSLRRIDDLAAIDDHAARDAISSSGHFEPKLGLKAKLLMEDREGRYLLYAAQPEPALPKNWLYDIECYSERFYADKATLVTQDLGLEGAQQRNRIAERSAFCASKARLAKLRKFIRGSESPLDLDRQMMAVTVKSDHDDFFSILHSIYAAMVNAGNSDGGDTSIEEYNRLDGYGLLESFWLLVKREFGYDESERQSLRRLLNQLFATEFVSTIANAPTSLEANLDKLVLRKHQSTVAVCLSRWRDSSSSREVYERLASIVADDLKVEDLLTDLSAFDLKDCVTFEEVDRKIIRDLRDLVAGSAGDLSATEFDAASIKSLISKRLTSFWADERIPDSGSTRRRGYSSIYQALGEASEFLVLCREHASGFAANTPAELFAAYTSDYYRFDMRYRRFYEMSDRDKDLSAGLLGSVQQAIEKRYVNWYLDQLSQAWDAQLDGGFIKDWHLSEHGVRNQHDFYAKEVEPRLEKHKNAKVFVIISDAMRYEVARELCEEINGRHRIKAEIKAQLGVLPSYTKLGMASLLPHKQLEYNEKGDVRVDGQSTAGLAQRGKILSKYDGMALKATELLSMSKSEGRATVKDARVIYLYHDLIDETGDSAKSEDQVFDAARQTIDELNKLVAHIVNSLNGSQVLITADHGFLYQREPLDDTDRNQADIAADDVYEKKKRYMVGPALPTNVKSVYRGLTKIASGTDCDTTYLLPRGNNRFYFTGGSKFVHGGAMLQEVAVPVISINEARGTQVEKTKVDKVGVQVLGSKHRITAASHKFRILQLEAVSERRKAVTIDLAIFDDAEIVSTKERLAFDRSEENELGQAVLLKLLDREFDRTKNYMLRLEDVETGVMLDEISVTIDRTFSDDF